MKLTVLGPGCWGLTLARLLTPNFDRVCVWGREQDISDELRNEKKTTKPVTVELDKKTEITSDLREAVCDANFILMVIATSGIRAVSKQLAEVGLRDEQILVNTSKGLELPSLMTMSEVIKQELPNVKPVILSGPTLAKEVLAGLPTAACVACEDEEKALYAQKCLNV